MKLPLKFNFHILIEYKEEVYVAHCLEMGLVEGVLNSVESS